MTHWLLKSDPDEYSFADLERETQTRWDGVTNNLALIHMRSMRKGDLCFIYHSGAEKSVVGMAEIVSPPYPDPEANDPRRVVVDVRAKKRLAWAVTLDAIKKRKKLGDLALVRISRLSVMPVTPAHWKIILSLSTPR